MRGGPSSPSVINCTWDDPSRKDDLIARGSDSFSWDYEDRMVSATVNSMTTNFTYRGDGLRDSRAVSGGATTTFTWDIAGELPVVLDDGNQYVYGAGLTAQKQSGSWYYYLADGLGSTMAVVNASGVVQDCYTYDIYGKPTKTGSLANEFDFAGQQTDGTGLQYLRARYYDPATGTFLNSDPLSRRPSWIGSIYSYASATPANATDPTGLCSWYDLICSFGSAAGAAWGVGVSAAGAAVGWSQDAVDSVMSAVSSAYGWVRDAAWSDIRAFANAKLTAGALAVANAYGGNCSGVGSGIQVCGGMGALLDALGIPGDAFTLGNVILTRVKSAAALVRNKGASYIEHEIRHSDQWAWFGLGAIAGGNDPLSGQGVMFLAYMANQGIAKLFGGGKCQNIFEIWAGLSAGNYRC